MRRVRAAGGFATVLARGDERAGAILILCTDRGVVHGLVERTTDYNDNQHWTRCGPQDVESGQSRESYIQRRRLIRTGHPGRGTVHRGFSPVWLTS
jgi:hypothetical protein